MPLGPWRHMRSRVRGILPSSLSNRSSKADWRTTSHGRAIRSGFGLIGKSSVGKTGLPLSLAEAPVAASPLVASAYWYPRKMRSPCLAKVSYGETGQGGVGTNHVLETDLANLEVDNIA